MAILFVSTGAREHVWLTSCKEVCVDKICSPRVEAHCLSGTFLVLRGPCLVTSLNSKLPRHSMKGGSFFLSLWFSEDHGSLLTLLIFMELGPFLVSVNMFGYFWMIIASKIAIAKFDWQSMKWYVWICLVLIGLLPDVEKWYQGEPVTMLWSLYTQKAFQLLNVIKFDKNE